MKVFSFDLAGRDGKTYSVRMLLTPQELAGLQAAGLVPKTVAEVVGMQDFANGVAAMFERDHMLQCGGTMQ